MYCPECKQEYDGKFCPECGTKLIEKAPESAGFAVDLGRDNVINEMQVNDSRTFTYDNSVTNTNYVTNNVVERQKTTEELKNEAKAVFAQYCKEAFQDGILTEEEKNFLKSKQLELGLNDDEATLFIEQYRKSSSSKSSELSTSAAVVMGSIGQCLYENNTKMLGAHILRLRPIAKMFDVDEVQYLYNLVMAAINPDELIKEYESGLTDKYWRTYWVYIAYLKKQETEKAEYALNELNKFSEYGTENSMPLTAISMYNEFGVEVAGDFANAISPEMCSDVLEEFINALFALISPDRINVDCENIGMYKFYAENIIDFTRVNNVQEADAEYKEGLRLKEEEDYEEAFECFKKAVEKGNIDAMVELGNCYYDGYGVEKDRAKAFEYFEKAAEKENTDAMTRVGDYYNDAPEDWEKAIEWYEKAAKRGNTNAMVQAGYWYRNALDNTRAFEYFKKAVEKGNVEAMGALASAYKYGEGVEKDYIKAFEWYEKAAEEGDFWGLYYFGEEYLDKGENIGVEATIVYKSIKKIAGEKFFPAIELLGRFYEKGIGVIRNKREAFNCYKKAKDIVENKEGRYKVKKSLVKDRFYLYLSNIELSLARAYYFGIGVERNEEEAFNLYKNTLEGKGPSDPQIREKYAKMMFRREFGISTETAQLKFEEGLTDYLNNEDEEAFETWLDLAIREYAPAQYEVARMYSQNLPSFQLDNREKAIEWYKKVITNTSNSKNHIQAQYELGNCYNSRGETKAAIECYSHAGDSEHRLATYKLAEFFEHYSRILAISKYKLWGQHEKEHYTFLHDFAKFCEKRLNQEHI